jgi:HicA toxin of bacterial toxin-antitoxin,
MDVPTDDNYQESLSRLNNKNKRTLEQIFEQPVRVDIRWLDVETLLTALGAEIKEGRGSRVSLVLRGKVHSLHKPHPSPVLPKYAVSKLHKFLEK